MRNPVISPYFDEASYKGQDVVHQGVRIPLTGYMPLDLLVKFDKSAQQRIKLPAQDDSGIKYEQTVNSDLLTLRTLWFDPADKTFPDTIEGHIGITARLNGRIIGGVLWAMSGKNLFMHQLISGDEGKELHLPTKLIWESVVRYCNKGWHSLDIGVSYNPKRYAFFKQFAVETYPIILKKPHEVPVIRLSPFRGFKTLPDISGEKMEGDVTFLPRATYAIEAALRHAGVGPGDQVNIIKTFGSQYVSSCVTRPIEKLGATWKVRDLMRVGTKAVIVVHEFGIPVYQQGDMDLLAHARELGIPVIEDCAWMWRRKFSNSKYAVFSCSKIFDMNFGGLLVGAHIDDTTLWSWGMLDVVKRDRYLRTMKSVGLEQRRQNWRDYHTLVKADGMTPDDCYDYEAAIESGEWMPTVYLQRFKDDAEADAIVARLEEFGIQAGRYWGEPIVFLPVHQNMTTEEVEYMFAVVRGYFNLCRDYGK